jgi:peptide/nickel transport system ATP-binding protein
MEVKADTPATGRDAPDRPPLLDVSELQVEYTTDRGIVRAVDGVDLQVRAGEVVGLVGESGCGKSAMALSLMGLLPRSVGKITGGRIVFDGSDLVGRSERFLRRIRGCDIAMVFQDPMTSLNPVYRVGDQMTEMMRAHRDVSNRDARTRVVELLRLVGIPNADRRVNDYPHEFSGGMRQRVMIAMALSLEPEVLIADEPTTALDVTVQAQILRLIEQFNRERDLAVVLITHDLGVVAEIADRVLVMYAGQIVEDGTIGEIFYNPQHPYTWGLLGSLARLDQPRPPRLPQIAGLPPSLLAPPSGCRFAPRCPHAFDKCAELPPLVARSTDDAHLDRCWLDPARKVELRTVDGRIGLGSR